MAENRANIDMSFLGFSLLQCDYHRDFDSGYAKKLFIVVNSVETKNDNIIEIKIRVDITFKNDTTSKFEYLAHFGINDIQWFERENKENKNFGVSNLFSLVFPYVRSSISSITNDSLGEIRLPIINVIRGDITKGVSFTSYNAK